MVSVLWHVRHADLCICHRSGADLRSNTGSYSGRLVSSYVRMVRVAGREAVQVVLLPGDSHDIGQFGSEYDNSAPWVRSAGVRRRLLVGTLALSPAE
jgi:hypothetical protein